MKDNLIGWSVLIIFVIAMILMVAFGDPPAAPGAMVTAHVYTNETGGSVIYCPEELDPVPSEWDYNVTAEISEDDVLEQCELE